MSSPSRSKGRARSILTNLLILAVIWCSLSIGVAAVVLIELFRDHITEQVRVELNSQLVQLIAVTERTQSGDVRLRVELADPRFARPLSNWAWQIRRGETVLLQSASLGPLSPGPPPLLEAPSGDLGEFQGPLGHQLTGLSREVAPRFSPERLTFAIARPVDEIADVLSRFRNIVIVVLAILGIGQVATAFSLMRTGLTPLKTFTDWVAAIRHGANERPETEWPREIAPVAEEIEALEGHVDRLVTRARGQAADLAHSIKTPLTVLRQIGDALPEAEAAQVHRQNDRIEAALGRHLARVRSSGRGYALVSVAEVVADLRLALEKTMEMRQLSLVSAVPKTAALRCDENDLYEIIGNVLDNACKWAKARISVGVERNDVQFSILVEDDGPGVAPDQLTSILERGTRLDEARPGHGLGLSIVRELVELYSGSLELGVSDLGGLLVRVNFPSDQPAN